jgi:hypothetical protein
VAAPGTRDPEGTRPAGTPTAALAPVVRAAPGVVRVTGMAAFNASVWGARAYVHTGLRLARATVDRDERAALVHDTAEVVDVVVDVVRSLLPTEGPRGRAEGSPGHVEGSRGHADVPGHHDPSARHRDPSPVDDTPEGLRRRGADLLERSRDVWVPESGHPAYSRILEELAPDEARILLHLLQEGPQPSVDVRAGGMRGGTLVAPGLSMIGARSGVRYVEQVPIYLNNLLRLGLIWFSKEALRDTMEYQVLEAQPDVLAALHTVTFAKVVRRSIQLTPFGTGFCRACLVQDARARMPFPEHASPVASEESDPPKA